MVPVASACSTPPATWRVNTSQALHGISVQRAFQQLRMLARSDFATVAQRDHLVPQVLVENRRMVVDQHLRSAGGDEGLMELPIISLPFLRMRPFATAP